MADGKVVIDTVLNTQGAASGVSKLGKVLGKVGTLVGVAFSVAAISKFIDKSKELYDVQLKAQKQLAQTLKNQGKQEDSYNRLIKKAQELQGLGIYGDESFIGGAAELATYMSDTEAIEKMMDTLATYAAGMSGGTEVGYQQMVDYATNIGKIMTGSYDAMTKKGFEFTDAQKAIMKGTASESQMIEALGEDWASMTEDMRKATVISDIINESWGGMYETLSDTPQGKLTQLKNSLGDVQEKFGEAFAVVQNMVIPIIQRLVDWLDVLADATIEVADMIAKAFGGKTSKEISNISKYFDGATDSIDETEESAKSLKNALGGYDELNIIGSNQESAETTSVTTIEASIETEPLQEQEGIITSAIENIKEQLSSFEGMFSELQVSIGEFWLTMSEMWSDIQSLVDPFISMLQTEFLPVLQNVFGYAIEYSNAYLQSVTSVFSNAWTNVIMPFLNSLINTFLPLILSVSDSILSVCHTINMAVLEITTTLWNEAIVPLASLIVEIFNGIGKVLKDFWDEYGKPITEQVNISIQKAKEYILTLWSVIKPIFDTLIDVVSELWRDHLQPVFSSIMGVIGEIIEIVLALYNNALYPMYTWAVATFGPMFSATFSYILKVVGIALGGIIDFIKDVIEWFRSILKFLKDVFMGNWDAVFDDLLGIVQSVFNLVWNAIKRPFESASSILSAFVSMMGSKFSAVFNIINNIFGGVINVLKKPFEAMGVPLDEFKNKVSTIMENIKTTIKTKINGIIGFMNGMITAVQNAINAVVGAFNKLSWDVPSWVPGIGGKKFGFNISTVTLKKIPELATGAVIPANSPFLAMLGDQKSGTNIEAPLETIVQAMKQALGDMGTNVNVYLEGDAKGVFRLVRSENDKYRNQTGVSALA